MQRGFYKREASVHAEKRTAVYLPRSKILESLGDGANISAGSSCTQWYLEARWRQVAASRADIACPLGSRRRLLPRPRWVELLPLACKRGSNRG